MKSQMIIIENVKNNFQIIKAKIQEELIKCQANSVIFQKFRELMLMKLINKSTNKKCFR